MRAFTSKASKLFLLLAVVAALLIGVAACNRNGDDPGETGTGPGVGTNGTGVTPGDDPGAPELPPADLGVIHPAMDLGQRTITFVVHWGPGGFSGIFSEEPDPETAADYELARMMYDNVRRVERMFNVNFDWINTVDYGSHNELLVMSHLAGNAPGDIVLVPGSQSWAMVEGGMLHDLAQLTLPNSQFDLLTNNHYTVRRFTRDNGARIYGFHQAERLPDSWTLGVNLDMVDQLGLANPVDLYEAGQWTWDAMASLMAAATNPHERTFGASGWAYQWFDGFMASNNAPRVTADLRYGLGEPNALVALEAFTAMFANRWYQYNDFNPDMPPVSWDWTWHSHVFREGQSLFFPVQTWLISGNTGAEGIPFDFAMVPFPLGPNNGGTGFTWKSGSIASIAIPVHVENPEHVLMVIEEAFAWPGEDLWLWYEAGAGWPRTHLPRERDVVVAQRAAAEGRMEDIGLDIGVGGFIFQFANDVGFNGTMTIAEVVEIHHGPSQALINERLGVAHYVPTAPGYDGDE
jgi:multiple sugar transport system substrate-binding protein